MDLLLKEIEPSKVLFYPFQETTILKSFILSILVTSLSLVITIEFRTLIFKFLIIKRRKKSIQKLLNKYKNINKSNLKNSDLIADLIKLILKDESPNLVIKIFITFTIAFMGGFLAFWLIHIFFGWGKECTAIYNNNPKSLIFN